MKILSKAEREQARKTEFRNKIIFVIIMAIVVYIVLYFLLIDTTFKGYKRNESLNHKYDLSKEIIPDPKQKSVPNESFVVKVKGQDVTIKKLASYDITGKVEGIKDYNTNALAAKLSMQSNYKTLMDYMIPMDLALSWGELSLNENNEHVFANEDARDMDRAVQVGWDAYLQNKFGYDYIISHISNNHLLCLDRGIRSEFSKVKEGQVVRIVGYLVEIKTENGATWRSSLTRDDVNKNFQYKTNCETIYVEDFIIMK